MTDNEIVKALECCNSDNDCKNCPLMRRTDVNCDDTLKKEVLDLIKRQQAESAKAKSEAITEFAERLKRKMCGWCFDFEYYSEQQLAEEQVDNLVKEMTEGNNGA